MENAAPGYGYSLMTCQGAGWPITPGNRPTTYIEDELATARITGRPAGSVKLSVLATDLFEIEPGGDRIHFVEAVRRFTSTMDVKETAAFLKKLRYFEPKYVRGYVAEVIGDERLRWAVELDPITSFQKLAPSRDDRVRGTVIEARSLALIKQLRGQEATRKKLAFVDDIAKDGRLMSAIWHNGPTTNMERSWQKRIHDVNREHDAGEKERLLRQFERTLGV
jgi:hypothetical protein